MALGKEQQTPNNELQAITTLLSLVLEKSSKIDDLEKTIKAIDFKPQIVNNLNKQALAEDIAENLKFKGVKINEKQTFVKIFMEDWKKYTSILILSIGLAFSIFTNYRLSQELNNRVFAYDDTKNVLYSTSKTGNYESFIQNLLNYREVKETKSKSKK